MRVGAGVTNVWSMYGGHDLSLTERGKFTGLVFYPRQRHGIQEYYHQKDHLTRIHAWPSRYVLGDGRKTTTQ